MPQASYFYADANRQGASRQTTGRLLSKKSKKLATTAAQFFDALPMSATVLNDMAKMNKDLENAMSVLSDQEIGPYL